MTPQSLRLALFLFVAAATALGAAKPTERKSKIVAAYSRPAFSLSVQGATEEVRSRCPGEKTSLELVVIKAKVPQHDVDLGKTNIVLRDKASGTDLLHANLSEIWECLAFNRRTGKYLIGSKNEHGTKVTLRALLYVDERQKIFADSVFDEVAFEAVASLLSPGERFLALIGAPTEKPAKTALYVLDTDLDKLSLVGDAPAPPPLTAQQIADPEAKDMLGPWDAPERHYTELEKGIWSFLDADSLEVSYGKDSLSARAKERTKKKWNLRALHDRKR